MSETGETNVLTEWKCKRCTHTASSKSNLLKHLRRKTPCTTTTRDTISIVDYIAELLKKEYNDKTYDCPYCNAKFNAYQNRHRHVKSCKDAKPDDKNTIINLLEEQNALLRQQLQQQQQNTQQVVNITNNTNNTINIQVNNFGNEDTSHLTHDLLSHCLMNPTKGLSKLIDNIHYNPLVPSNHNIRYKSTKQNSFEKYVDEHWMECDASNTLDELIRKGYRVLNAHYTEHYLTNPEFMENEIQQRALERFRFLSDKTCNEYHSVKRDLRLLVKDRTMYVVGLPLDNVSDVGVEGETSQSLDDINA